MRIFERAAVSVFASCAFFAVKWSESVSGLSVNASASMALSELVV